jgi:dihydrofolate synthase / folylpolyglutamate synthase
MDYRQTLDYLFTRLPLFSRIGAAAYKEDLDNTIYLCNYLDNPHQKFKSVHIAGTNGKGSVSHMLAAVLQTSGYKTGLYTSPHLKDFRERIRINGKMISEDFVVDFTRRINPCIEKIDPSFFEITVAMAFDYFAKEKVDIAIVEVGLGGRLDSTNVITPEISVITNISWDHSNLLGDTLEKIAGEKAGIIKEGIPVVIGEVIPETKPVFERTAIEKKAPLFIATDRFRALEWTWENHQLVVQLAEQHKNDHLVYHLDLPGVYQTKNLPAVLETCRLLQQKGWQISDTSIQHALQKVKKLTGLHGRWEIVQQHPLIVLDVGHNEAGIRQILEQIEITDHRELHFILGMVKDKDTNKILNLFPSGAHYYFTQSQIPRALEAGALKEMAASFKLHGETYPDVNIALQEAKRKAHKDDLLVVCGSIFLIGEII